MYSLNLAVYYVSVKLCDAIITTFIMRNVGYIYIGLPYICCVSQSIVKIPSSKIDSFVAFSCMFLHVCQNS